MVAGGERGVRTARVDLSGGRWHEPPAAEGSSGRVGAASSRSPLRSDHLFSIRRAGALRISAWLQQAHAAGRLSPGCGYGGVECGVWLRLRVDDAVAAGAERTADRSHADDNSG